MTYASLRFADVQWLRPFEVNEDAIRGTLLSSKQRNRPPRTGIGPAHSWDSLARPIGYSQL